MTTSTTPAADTISSTIVEFVARQTKQSITAEDDLFGSGLVSSLFAMQLVAHVESTFGVTVPGPDLRIDNFRTVAAITDLVLRLRQGNGG
jgi:methoxymalonate biosynthesis acyl carrier protein